MVNARIEESVPWCFGHVERMEDRTAKRIYVRECAGSHSVGWLLKRWIDTVTEYIRKRGLDVRQARGMVQDRSESWGIVRRSAWGITWRMNPRR